MTNWEERFWELREVMDRARSIHDHKAYTEAYEEYISLCASIFGKIMKEHSDV